MIPLRNKTRRQITIAFITLLCVGQIAFPFHWTVALVPVEVIADPFQILDTIQDTITAGATTEIAGSAAATTITSAATAVSTAAISAKQIEEFISKYVLIPALRVALITLIQSTSNEIVGWIKGDGGRNVGFVKNLEQNAFNEANQQAGEFLNHVSGINLCSLDISKLIKLQVNVPGYQHLNAQLACSLTGIVDNIDKFYQDFNNGGWPAFVGIAVDSRNNAIGASMIAEVNFQAKKGSAAEALQNRLNRGSGFKGVTLKKKSRVCETRTAPVIPVDEIGTNVEGKTDTLPFDEIGGGAGADPLFCYTQEVDTTPGGVVADALNESLNHVGIELGAATISSMTSEIDAAVGAIITALMQRLFKEATNLF